MNNLTVENVYTRHKAKELAKQHFWKLLGMMLIVAVIIYAISFGGMMLLGLITGGPATSVNTTGMSAVEAAMAAAANPATPNVGFFVGYFVLMIVMVLVSGGLRLGLTSAMIDLCRSKEHVTVGRLFSRMSQCLKALGLNLWVGLKIFLWALPAYGVMVVVAFIILGMGQNSEAATVLLMLLPLVVMIAVFALVIPAYYRYMLSTYILADKPETGIRACVRSSTALMKGHKWQAFKLIVPLFLALYGVMFLFMLGLSLVMAAASQISEVLMVILAIVCFLAFFLLMMYFSIRMSLAYCLFYLNRIGENCTGEAAAESAAEPAEAPAAEDAAE